MARDTVGDGKTMPIDIEDQGFPPQQREQTQKTSGSVVGSGTRADSPQR